MDYFWYINRFMDFTNIKAAVVELTVDADLLTKELLSIPDDAWDTGYDKNSGCSWRSIFLRKNNIKDFTDFKNQLNDIYDMLPKEMVIKDTWDNIKQLDIEYFKFR